jgi:hypothetical protein
MASCGTTSPKNQNEIVLTDTGCPRGINAAVQHWTLKVSCIQSTGQVFAIVSTSHGTLTQSFICTKNPPLRTGPVPPIVFNLLPWIVRLLGGR